jgi:hypothetical protein
MDEKAEKEKKDAERKKKEEERKKELAAKYGKTYNADGGSSLRTTAPAALRNSESSAGGAEGTKELMNSLNDALNSGALLRRVRK